MYSGADKASPDKAYFDELKRVSKNQIIFGANYMTTKINDNSSCWLEWDKENGENNFADCELAYTSFKTDVRKFAFKWQGMLQGDMKHKEECIHPNQKTVKLYEWILSNYPKSSDRILETHLGSGSSRIAAYEMGFDFVGTEIDKAFFSAQEKRFKEYTAQGSLFPFDGGMIL